MKICLAQTKSTKGDLLRNLEDHLKFVNHAIKWRADLIVFPELSLTGYEPTLAANLARELEDPIFDPFQKIADKNSISIAAGMPIKTPKGIVIGMIIFQPNMQRSIYAKQLLHDDELPYFVAGENQFFINLKEEKIAPAICYEAFQRDHFIKSNQAGTSIYLTSVAKSESGVAKAYDYFSTIFNEFSTPILMVNSVGFADDFMAAGQTAAWNAEGEIMGQLDNHHSGMLLVDFDLGTTEEILVK